jgi:regulator of protease activity HflC (stomatin/prohibitin superfamily)
MVETSAAQQPEGSNKTEMAVTSGGLLNRLFRVATVILAAFVLAAGLFVVGRSAIYKIHEYERGLHLRGGRFVAVDDPGWHIQIPLVDTVIIVTVNERLGYVERVSAMTSDDVTMDVSLQYTYRVRDPKTFALQVDDPERIIFEFVQGKLRDVVNTKPMTEVMHSRAAMNQEVMAALAEKENQYGVEFITVQIQGASPPEEVVVAIKDRMVAVQRQEQAEAEAAQRRTLADAEYYAAQKTADGDAYEITKLAEADAQRIALTSEAQQAAVQAMLDELQRRGALGEAYIQLLIAQELKSNSKWIISGGQGGDGIVPRIELPTTP